MDDIMIRPVCKDCEERHVGCHDRCGKYQEFKAARVEEVREIKKYKEATSRVKVRVGRVESKSAISPLKCHKR